MTIVTKDCRIKNCDRNYYCQGFCSHHYRLAKISGEIVNKRKEKHGYSWTSEYSAWSDMKARCYKPTLKIYKYYGGRGIKVCDSWLESFEKFLEDMGSKPASSYSLDRIDHNGDYKPENCRWTTWTVQAINKGMNSRNKSGVKGVSWNKQHKKWCVFMSVNGKGIFCGYYNTLQEAKEKRLAMYEEYYLPVLDAS